MNKLTFSLFAIVLATLSTASSQRPDSNLLLNQLPNGSIASPYEPNQILVKLRQDVAARDAVSRPTINLATGSLFINREIATQVTFKRSYLPTGWTLWTTTPGTNIPSLAKSLKAMPGIYGAEPVYMVHAMLATPNDADYNQYEMNSVYYGGSDPTTLSVGPFLILWNLVDDNAFSGWSTYPNTWYTATTLPRYRPRIAMLDTGIDFSHPDFVNAGGSGPDVSQGGQIDVTDSGSIVGGTWQPGIAAATDGNGHGTHTCGLALAAGNNGADPVSGHGMIGTGYPCEGVIVQVLPASGSANSDADLGAGIQHAADLGVEVISMSLGETPYSQFMQDMVNYAFQKGSLVVAAGNENGNGGGALPTAYPAGCTSALAVTANAPGQTPASYAGNGQYIDIAAPGGDFSYDFADLTYIIQPVWSTLPTNTNFTLYDPSGAINQYPVADRYAYLLGTSMATPQVSGAAGLYYAQHGLHHYTGYTNVQVFRALEESADNTAGTSLGEWEPTQGYGSLDIGALMGQQNTRGATMGAIKGIIYENGTATQNVEVTAQAITGGQTFYTTSLSDGTYRFGGMPPGIYNVKAAPNGLVKQQLCQVDAGSDAMGVDIWAGPYSGDTTPPTVAYFEVTGDTQSSVTVKQWGYDVDTSISSIVFQIGTTSGKSDVMAETNIVPDASDTVNLSNLNLTFGTTYYLTGTWTNGGGLTTTLTIPFNYGDTCTIEGSAVLDHWGGSPQPITVLTRAPGSLVTLHTYTIYPTATGAYSLALLDAPGTYDLAFKASHWLRKVIHNVTVSYSTPAQASVSLLNGDVNGDNVVNQIDLNAIKAAWNTRPGDAKWNPNADLNGDGVVNRGDELLMDATYMHHGDP